MIVGLHERFATVTTPRALVAILAYEPTAVHDYPLLYSILDSFERTRHGQVLAWHWRTMHRLLLRWQSSEECEIELRAFVNSIPEALDLDPHLGGRLVSGYADIAEADAGWTKVGDTECRYVDFYSTVIEK